MNKHGGYFGDDDQMLDFSVNLNPLGMPKKLKAEISKQWMMKQLENYPEPSSLKARQSVAKHLDQSPDRVIIGNGATELIYLLARTLKAETVMIVQPTFNEYERAFGQYGSRCIYYRCDPRKAFDVDDDDLKAALRGEKPDVLVICNPNNPTGAYMDPARIEGILSIFPGIVMIDESFADFERLDTAIGLVGSDRLFLLRSMTKYYAIAGIRLGYAIAGEALIRQMNQNKEPWTVNALASDILPLLFEDRDYEAETGKWYEEEKNYLYKALSEIPYLEVLPSHANYHLCRTKIESDVLYEDLIRRGICCRICEDFIGLGKNYIRLAVRSRDENKKLIETLSTLNYLEVPIMLDTIISLIKHPDQEIYLAAKKRLDSLAKPLGSLGRLEEIAAQIAAIQGKINPVIEKKCTIIMASDHGIVEEGVACAPQEVTAIQTVNMTKGLTGICVISKANGADIRVVDIGVKGDLDYPGIIQKKIRYGTDNFAKGPAMTRQDAIKSLETGIEMVGQLVSEGYDLFGTGEMGIGNTSCSSAVLMTFTGCSADIAVGKGGGITDEAFAHKKRVIEDAIALNQPNPQDPLDVLAKVGGLDLGGMTGCFLGAARYGRPIVIDGLISAAAALLAYKINPLVKAYMIPSHFSAEPGYKRIMDEMGLEPIFHLNMRLGEGTGCPIAFSVIDTSLAVLNDMGTFDDAMIDNEYLVDIRKK